MAKLQEHAKIATAASTQLLAAANGAERCNGKSYLFLATLRNLMRKMSIILPKGGLLKVMGKHIHDV